VGDCNTWLWMASLAMIRSGREESSRADRRDLNVPLALECEVVGMLRVAGARPVSAERSLGSHDRGRLRSKIGHANGPGHQG